VPQPHGPTEVARDGTLSVWCQRVGPYLTLVVKLGGLFSELSARGWRFLDGRCRGSAASSEELRIFLAAVRRQPTDVQKLRQRAFGGGIVEAQGNEAALLVQRVAKAVCAGFQLCPVGTERVSRHAEPELTGVLPPFLDLRRVAVAGADFPVIEPHAQAVRPQPLGEGADDFLILGAVAQEDIEGE